MDFWSRVTKTKTCWKWKGSHSENGYARFQIKGKRMAVHRYLYECENGDVPEGLELDHLCRNRWCIRPDHLEAVTHSENVRRGWEVRIKNTPNCPNGHPYSGKNLYIVHDKKNNKSFRGCKLCRLENNRRWVAKFK